MANENDNITPENNDQPEKKHTWLGDMLEKIDTDFPLSGGESDEDLEPEDDSDERIEPDGPEEMEKNEEKGDSKSWFGHMLDNVDTDFPLSGGEEEDDK
ncbi:MAG: hypothetical protein JWQ38_1389 [Flavipsychrobacter sp.]|nr:hypothetical protein [Flavipsychrobacter sp.]